jgi:hypothetical protein
MASRCAGCKERPASWPPASWLLLVLLLLLQLLSVDTKTTICRPRSSDCSAVRRARMTVRSGQHNWPASSSSLIADAKAPLPPYPVLHIRHGGVRYRLAQQRLMMSIYFASSDQRQQHRAVSCIVWEP